MKRSRFNHLIGQGLVLGVAALVGLGLLGLGGCGKKSEGGKPEGNKVFELKELGVKVTAPGDWRLKKRGDRWALLGGMKGVMLGKDSGPVPASVEEAGKRFAESKILASEKLPNGGIYLFYQMKFKTGGGMEPMWLKFVWTLVPLKDGSAVVCSVQLQADDEQSLYEPICRSVTPL